MKRALASAIGLPNSSTSALRMLVLLIPAEVRRSFIKTMTLFMKILKGRVLSETKIALVATNPKNVVFCPFYSNGPFLS
jgi:hypothetical protein